MQQPARSPRDLDWRCADVRKLRDAFRRDSQEKEETMNTLLRKGMYVPMAAMILTALCRSYDGQEQVPFKGALQGHEIDTPQGGPPPTTLNVDGSATGIVPMSVNSHSPTTYGDPRERHRNRDCSIDRGQWRQHLFDSCRIE